MQKYSFFFTIVFFILILTVISCKTVPEPELQLLSKDEVQAFSWEDDLDVESLSQAIRQSIRYYRSIPEFSEFDYMDTRYSPREMEASLNLFLEIIQTYQGEQRIAEIQKKFLFFESKNSNNSAFFTGYYEPILSGRLNPNDEFPTPLYATPADLLSADLGAFSEKWEGRRIFGKIKGHQFIPYDSREQIVYQHSLQERVDPLVYVENDIELFFLQIQGSGLVQLPDGHLKRVNYAAQNGHPYRAIGRLLIEEDKVPREKMSMQAIKDYLYNNPEEVRRILNYNPSYTFFREVEEGPLGYMEVPLTAGRSIAMDRKLIPRGGLVYVTTQIPLFENDEIIGLKPFTRFMLTQDTGGAIRGHGRGDIFWGHGQIAELTAGHMQHSGRVFLLIARKEFLKSSLDLTSQQ